MIYIFTTKNTKELFGTKPGVTIHPIRSLALFYALKYYPEKSIEQGPVELSIEKHTGFEVNTLSGEAFQQQVTQPTDSFKIKALELSGNKRGVELVNALREITLEKETKHKKALEKESKLGKDEFTGNVLDKIMGNEERINYYFISEGDDLFCFYGSHYHSPEYNFLGCIINDVVGILDRKDDITLIVHDKDLYRGAIPFQEKSDEEGRQQSKAILLNYNKVISNEIVDRIKTVFVFFHASDDEFFKVFCKNQNDQQWLTEIKSFIYGYKNKVREISKQLFEVIRVGVNNNEKIIEISDSLNKIKELSAAN